MGRDMMPDCHTRTPSVGDEVIDPSGKPPRIGSVTGVSARTVYVRWSDDSREFFQVGDYQTWPPVDEAGESEIVRDFILTAVFFLFVLGTLAWMAGNQ